VSDSLDLIPPKKNGQSARIAPHASPPRHLNFDDNHCHFDLLLTLPSLLPFQKDSLEAKTRRKQDGSRVLISFPTYVNRVGPPQPPPLLLSYNTQRAIVMRAQEQCLVVSLRYDAMMVMMMIMMMMMILKTIGLRQR